MMFLSELTNSGIKNVDSTNVDEKGNFILKGYGTIPKFYLLSADKSNGIHLVIESGDNIRIYINSVNYDMDYVVEGSAESRRISKLIREQNKTLEHITDLSEEYEQIKGEPDFIENKAKLDSTYNIIFNAHKAFSKSFILEDPASFSSLMALYQQLGRRAPVFDIKEDFDLFELVDSSLSAIYPSSEAVKNLNEKVVEFRDNLRFQPGSVAPDIALADTSGKVLELSELKNRTVLLSFSASWCTRCINENEHLKQIYRKYHNSGFEIFQISLDKDKDSWENTIRNEEIPWISVSDLKYWNSAAAELYRIKKVPYYFLIGPSGHIVANNISITDLEHELNERF